MQLSENAHRVLEARYLRRDAQGRVNETPEQLFVRVARAVAHTELLLGNWEQATLWEERFYHLLTSFDFLPNSPTLMNAGTPLGQLSACFVLPVEDSIEPLFALNYRRVGVLGGQTLIEYNPLFLKIGERMGFLKAEVLDSVANHGTLAGAPHVPEAVRDLFATALENERI